MKRFNMNGPGTGQGRSASVWAVFRKEALPAGTSFKAGRDKIEALPFGGEAIRAGVKG